MGAQRFGADHRARAGRSAIAAALASVAPMKLAILGAGAWGTALARSCRGPRIRDAALGARCGTGRAQMRSAATAMRRYLPDIPFCPSACRSSADLDAAHRPCRSCRRAASIIATPMAALEPRRWQRLPCDGLDAAVLWLCKGFRGAWLHGSGHEVARDLARSGRLEAPFRRAIGPELRDRSGARPADGAGRGKRRCRRSRDACHRRAFTSPTLRVYTSADPVGVEVGGAVKNVLAIATRHRRRHAGRIPERFHE